MNRVAAVVLAVVAVAAFAFAFACDVASDVDVDVDVDADAAPETFTHEAYVWQRAWTPAVVEAVRTRGATFDALRVWGAEIETDGRVAVAAPPTGALAARPVVVVIRIDGSVPLDVRLVEPVVRDALATFAAAGAGVRGIEIDHDCATARLSSYAQLLAEMRGLRVPLSITALPAWSTSRALDDVLATVDHVVLQVHAVDAVKPGAPSLFSAQRARAFIDAFAPRAASAGVPWRVALPAYGSRVSFDDAGRIVSVASEESRQRARVVGNNVELRVEPADVATVLRALEMKRPRGLAGVVWFRLPVDGDRRAWSFTTLQAVRTGHDLTPRFDVVARPSADNASLFDVVVINRGVTDVSAPHRIELDVLGLAAADGVNSFSFDHGFSSLRPPRIAPGGELVVGWVRAQEVRPYEAHEAFDEP